MTRMSPEALTELARIREMARRDLLLFFVAIGGGLALVMAVLAALTRLG